MTPESTPREPLYIETGLLDIETIMDAERLSMMARLNRSKSELMTNILEHPQCRWVKQTKMIMEKYGIKDSDLEGPKRKTKANINQKIQLQFKEKMNEQREEKSKLK